MTTSVQSITNVLRPYVYNFSFKLPASASRLRKWGRGSHYLTLEAAYFRAVHSYSRHVIGSDSELALDQARGILPTLVALDAHLDEHGFYKVTTPAFRLRITRCDLLDVQASEAA